MKVMFYSMNGYSPAQSWLDGKGPKIRMIIWKYIERVSVGGAKKNTKSLGGGLFEIKIDKGPGYRVYFGQKENVTLVLLCCGTKGTQKRDISRATKYWRLYNA